MFWIRGAGAGVPQPFSMWLQEEQNAGWVGSFAFEAVRWRSSSAKPGPLACLPGGTSEDSRRKRAALSQLAATGTLSHPPTDAITVSPMYSAMKADSARTTSSRSTSTYSPVCSLTAAGGGWGEADGRGAEGLGLSR